MFDDSNITVNPLAILPPVKEPRLYTLAEFLHRSEKSEELLEYYDGIIKKLPMARTPHNIISTNMAFELEFAFRASNKDYYVMNSQQIVYLPKLNFGVYPDVLVVCEKPQHYDNNQVLLINPVLIVEVLSRSTRAYDRKEKFNEYKTLDSFKEYVLIDQKKCYVETRFKEAPNLWREEMYSELSEKIVLKSVDCAIDMAMIYRKIEGIK
jgi:Uma2 family endonuclease